MSKSKIPLRRKLSQLIASWQKRITPTPTTSIPTTAQKLTSSQPAPTPIPQTQPSSTLKTKLLNASKGFPQRVYKALNFLAILATIIAIPLAIIALLPESQKNQILYQFGLVPASPTPTEILTPLNTATLASYDIGVAVGYFAIPEAGSVDKEEADTLVSQVAQRLLAELESFQQEVALSIGFLDPATIGRIEGETRTIREANASELAKQYDADLVLYGEITKNDRGQLEIQPEFYVFPAQFYEALEMTGSYRLGKSIAVDGPLSALRNVMSVNIPLSARTTAVAQTFTGLTYYLLEDYPKALSAFQGAASQPGLNEIEGQEVFQVLIGNTYLKMASTAGQTGNTGDAETNIDKAFAAFELASEIDPNYSRPYTGIAALNYLRWNNQLQKTGESEFDFLQKAQQNLDQLDQAEDSLDKPEDIGVQTKTIFIGLQIDYAVWEFHQDMRGDTTAQQKFVEDFENRAQQIIRIYDDGNNPTVQELATETYGLLGFMDYSQTHYDQAINNFKQAVSLSPSLRRRMTFQGFIGDAYAELNQRETAILAYEEAINLGKGITDNPPQVLIDIYQEKINQLRQGLE